MLIYVYIKYIWTVYINIYTYVLTSRLEIIGILNTILFFVSRNTLFRLKENNNKAMY